MSYRWPSQTERLGNIVKHLKRALIEADTLKLKAHETSNSQLEKEAAWCCFHIAELLNHMAYVLKVNRYGNSKQ